MRPLKCLIGLILGFCCGAAFTQGYVYDDAEFLTVSAFFYALLLYLEVTEPPPVTRPPDTARSMSHAKIGPARGEPLGYREPAVLHLPEKRK